MNKFGQRPRSSGGRFDNLRSAPKNKICIGCRVAIENGATCADCWKKLPKELRTVHLAAKKALEENTSRKLERVARKKEALINSLRWIVFELNKLAPEATLDPVQPEAPTQEATP